jgi:hypothetical protein
MSSAGAGEPGHPIAPARETGVIFVLLPLRVEEEAGRWLCDTGWRAAFWRRAVSWQSA